MLHLSKILSFVPPALLFFLPAYSQLQGKIELVPGTNTIRVSVVPTVSYTAAESVTSSAQITLRATSGKLTVANFQSITGDWAAATTVVSPNEAPSFDYFSFSLNNPVASIAYSSGTTVPMFSFENGFGCTYVELIDNANDPFLAPNSMSINIENSFSIAAVGPSQNAYAGNTLENSVDCPALDVLALADQNPVPCNGDLTGVTIQAIGGIEPYEIVWLNQTTGLTGSEIIPVYEGVATIPYMDPGNYVFSITDARDSINQYNLLIAQPAPLTIEVFAYDATCNGSLDGVAFVNKVYGGTVAGDYQYYWNTNPGVSSETIGFLNPGIYTVTVIDDMGCSATGSAEVLAQFVVIPNPNITDISCAGASDGVIDIYPVSPYPPFTFEWSSNVPTGSNFSSAWQLGPGYYSVTITDATGICSATASYTIEEPPLIEIDYRIEEPHCHGDMASIQILAVENAVEPWEASIIGLGTLTTDSLFEVEPGMPQRLVIEDDHGCKIAEDFLVPDKQEMYVELGDNHTIKYGEAVDFDANIYPLQNVLFEWTPVEGLSCADCPNPVATPTDNITYRLRMVDTAGCEITDFVSVFVHKSRDIYIPNAFSPNRDGVNDKFIPYAGFEVQAIRSMQVFDRWGGLVYAAENSFLPGDPNQGWDGTTRGKTVPAGTYLYTMNVEFIDGEVVLYSGNIMLMR